MRSSPLVRMSRSGSGMPAVYSASLIVVSVQDAHVLWIGAPIDTSCPRVHIRICIRASREVPGCAVTGFQPDLTYSVQLRRIRIQRTLTLPIIEDA